MMKNIINSRIFFLFSNFILCLTGLFVSEGKALANEKNLSIYAYSHSSGDEKKLKIMLDKSALNPENIICGIGGFEENGDYNNWDCKLFFDNHKHIGAIESDQVQLGPKNATAAIQKLKQDNKYYKIIDGISLDCEPFYEKNINNVEFYIEFMKKIEDKKTSIYINPKNLVLLEKENKELLHKFMKTLKNSQGKILLPAYSYVRDAPKFEDIKNAISICHKYNVKYELILDTKEYSKLHTRIKQLKTIPGVNFSSFTIFSLEIDDDNLKSAPADATFGTRPYGSVKQQYKSFYSSMSIFNKLLNSKQK